MNRIKKTGAPAFDAQQAFMAEHLEEMRKLNGSLERIALALEARGAND